MIGENIKKIRLEKRLSLSELADRAQISKSYLSNIERNVNQNPSIQIMEKIAAVLRVEFQALMGEELKKDAVPEEAWIQFVNELKESGISTDQLSEYKTVIEFAKWKNDQLCREDS
ncbi:helix-turn-helix domain-containing protein [Virgibacillus sp. W0430]|uniref:helix-turn-helix domain-containing protein n=1 Tax=Virgibacillus sp. W0430 TaxID=3391580 RepID=UPI003F449349